MSSSEHVVLKLQLEHIPYYPLIRCQGFGVGGRVRTKKNGHHNDAHLSVGGGLCRYRLRLGAVVERCASLPNVEDVVHVGGDVAIHVIGGDTCIYLAL